MNKILISGSFNNLNNNNILDCFFKHSSFIINILNNFTENKSITITTLKPKLSKIYLILKNLNLIEDIKKVNKNVKFIIKSHENLFSLIFFDNILKRKINHKQLQNIFLNEFNLNNSNLEEFKMEIFKYNNEIKSVIKLERSGSFLNIAENPQSKLDNLFFKVFIERENQKNGLNNLLKFTITNQNKIVIEYEDNENRYVFNFIKNYNPNYTHKSYDNINNKNLVRNKLLIKHEKFYEILLNDITFIIMNEILSEDNYFITSYIKKLLDFTNIKLNY